MKMINTQENIDYFCSSVVTIWNASNKAKMTKSAVAAASPNTVLKLLQNTE